MGTEPKPTRPSGMRDSPEFNLIAAIRDRLAECGAAPAEDPGRVRLGPGDDAAITMPGGATATSVDAVVDGVHFRSEWCPPMSVGRKAMAAALSDLAAMGAAAGEAYVWLGRPDWLDDEGVLDLCDGLAVAAARDGVVVAGGDLTRASELAVSVTVVGHSHSP
jgi:thiamine-monophosphate kinase